MFTLDMLNKRLDELVEWEPRLTYETLIGFDSRLEVFIEADGTDFEDAFYLPERVLGDVERCNQLLTHRFSVVVTGFNNSVED